MIAYSSRSGKQSGVIAYEIGTDFIKVQFKGGKVYTYSYRSAGKDVIEVMKNLARGSNGLSTFITKNKPGYE